MTTSRRTFLIESAIALGATTFGTAALGATTRTPGMTTTPASKIPTRDTVLKFYPDGRVRTFKGNTVICHLPQQAKVRDTIILLRDGLMASSFAHKLGILPPESYHMTVYPGANDQDREVTGWPSYLPFNATIEECNRAVEKRMKAFRLECELPLRMKVEQSKTIHRDRASTLRMVGCDDAEERKIRRLRDRLVDVFGFRDRSHDTYGFHITLAYQLNPFSQNEQAEYRSLLERHVPSIVEAAPILELGIPEFCTFPDMYRFNIQMLLSQGLLSA